MQGKLIIGAFLIAAIASPSVAAVQQPQRQYCHKGDSSPPAVQQPRQRQQWAQVQPQRTRPQGCPVNRLIPSVVDPTPTFLI